MKNKRTLMAGAAIVGAVALTGLSVTAEQQSDETPEMGVFLTSVGTGDGANLGGLAGADAHCQALADAVGSGDRTWRAYLGKRERPGEGHQHRKLAL